MSPEDRQPLGKAAMTNEDAQASLAARKEKQLQENIAALLRLRNIWFMRQRMDRRTTGTLGAPDFLFSVNGEACAFEVKLPSAHLTDEQFACHIAMRTNGWIVFVVHSEAEAIQQLEAISRG